MPRTGREIVRKRTALPKTTERTPARTTEQRKEAFLAAYARMGTVAKGCEAAGIGRQTFYDWANADPVFNSRVAIAKQDFGDFLEDNLTRLATQQDNVTALIVALKMAGRFVERGQVDHTHSGSSPGKPIQVQVVYSNATEIYDLPSAATPGSEDNQE